ncbi:hypothetical protein JFU48_11370 [Pseudomonas sp. TH49]|uniref:hypothetical protein n=1 Tax=Pseudomonas sp. TH49 TaxID=2796413 RepID=UPI00191186B7|nr:hypothetical protein [Pseudomonas sp. TH49]MBK5341988.1 hypothetical protein [Pseudomonas sp. TH49]
MRLNEQALAPRHCHGTVDAIQAVSELRKSVMTHCRASFIIQFVKVREARFIVLRLGKTDAFVFMVVDPIEDHVTGKESLE